MDSVAEQYCGVVGLGRTSGLGTPNMSRSVKVGDLVWSRRTQIYGVVAWINHGDGGWIRLWGKHYTLLSGANRAKYFEVISFYQ